MSKLDSIKRKIEQNNLVIGTHVQFSNSNAAELLGDVGYDFVWIDSEHTIFNKKDLQLHIMALRGTGAAAFVRVAWNDPVRVKPILDMGPDGIIFPMIKTGIEAELAVSSCTYPPEGIRGFGPLRATKYGIDDTNEYIKHSSSHIWKIMQIEHVDGVNNLDEILTVKGVDAIVIGVNDLSGSIGMLGQTGHEKVTGLLGIIAEKTTTAGIPLGISTGYNTNTLDYWKDKKINWISIGSDVSFMLEAARATLNSTRIFFTSK